MKQMRYLVGRNLALFRSSRSNVLLSLCSIVIVMGIYAIFLRDFILYSVKISGLELQLVEEFTDRLMVGGLLVVLNTTTCFGIMQMCVADAASGIRRDFLVAPISLFQLLLGYWITSVLVSFTFTSITVVGGEGYFYMTYGQTMSLETLFQTIWVVLLASTINSGILLCIMRGIKNTTSFSTFGNLYGMMIGFLAGAYFPYNMYPKGLRELLFYFPPSHLTSLLRQLYLEKIEKIMVADGLSGRKVKLFEEFGVLLSKDGVVVSTREQWSILILSLAILLLVIKLAYTYSYPRKTVT